MALRALRAESVARGAVSSAKCVTSLKMTPAATRFRTVVAAWRFPRTTARIVSRLQNLGPAIRQPVAHTGKRPPRAGRVRAASEGRGTERRWPRGGRGTERALAGGESGRDRLEDGFAAGAPGGSPRRARQMSALICPIRDVGMDRHRHRDPT